MCLYALVCKNKIKMTLSFSLTPVKPFLIGLLKRLNDIRMRCKYVGTP